MKRSYGQTGQPASGPSSPYQATGPQGQAAIPPLPSGPPPPPPSSAPNPYAATAYNYSAYSAPQGAVPGAQQQPVAHPQYPGYGYGGAAAAAPASPYINYGAQQPAYPQAPTAAYPTGAYPTAPTAPQPGYGQQQPPPPPPGAYGQQQPGGYGYAPPPTQGYNNVPPPPQQQAYPSYPQQPLNPYATPAYPSGPPPIQQQPAYPGYGAPPPSQPSPLGAPPFKRTRYDSNGGPPPPMQGQGMQGPPPALPPLNAYGRGGANVGGRGGYNNQSNRGGYGDSASSHNQNTSRNGPPPPGSHHSQSYGNASPSGSTSSMNSHRGGGSRGNDNNMNMRGGGGARGGRGSGPMMTLPGRAGLPGIPAYPRGGGSGPSSLPSGPSNRSVSSSSSSNRGGRGGDRGGRPVSGLPGRGGAFGGRDHQNSGGRSSGGPSTSSYDLPKGPRSSRVSTSGAGGGGISGGLSAANSREGKKERKWGSKESGGATSTGKEDSRKTLTDFRISGLSIPDLQWDWRAEIVKAVVDVVVEAASSDPVEVSEERPTTPTSETIDLPTSKTPSMPPPSSSSILPEPKAESEPLSSPAKYDMSIDSIAPPSDDTPAEIKVEEEEEEQQPVKKLSKKQKKAEAASKRAATIAATKAGATLEAETQAESGATEEVVKTGEVVEKATPIVATTTTKKDGKNKHGRDEDEGGDGLVITEVTAAKKVKPDTDAVVILETTATEAPEEAMEDEIPTLAAEPPSEIPIATPLEIIKETPLSPLPTFIPTGPAADTGRLPILSSRENSRLRIYFSSPVSPPPAPVPVPSKRGSNSRKEKAVVLPSTSASTSTVSAAPLESLAPNVPAGTEAEVEAIEEEVDVDGDPVVGIKEESSDIDGEDIAQDSEGEAEEAEEEEEDEEEDEEEISSALLASAPVLVKAEEVEDAVVEVKEEVDDEALSAAGETIGSESLPVEEESIAGAVVSGGTTDVSPTTEVEPEISDAIVKEAAKSPPEPTADRISISYAKNTRRMVLDARVVEKVEIFRAEGKIEMSVLIQDSTAPGDDTLPDEFRVCKGILIEALDAEADDYVVIDRASLELAWRTREQQTVEDSQDVSPVDPLLPPFHHLLDDPSAAALQGEGLVISPGYTQNRITIVAYLDRINPLTEARWVKTGDCDSWVTSLALASNDSKAPVSEWKGKISVSDPEPPPTIQHALETWAASAGASALKVRTEFVTSHMSNIDHVFEILLRLTRGDRVIPSHHASSAQAPSVGVLAASLSAPYADQQTQISLAVLAMLRLSLETAAKAGIPAGEIEKQVGEIVRGIPYHLIFKSLDSMFASWKVSKNQKDKLKEAKEVKEAKEAKEAEEKK